MSRLTLLMPDLDARIGSNQQVIGQLMNIAAAFDADGTLPSPPFTQVTPDVQGHGETWYHEQGVFVMQTEHRPILLTTGECATCKMRHMDVCRMYLMMSPIDFEGRAYMRYASVPVASGEPTSTSGGG